MVHDLTGKDLRLCPCCRKGRMRMVRKLIPLRDWTPEAKRLDTS